MYNTIFVYGSLMRGFHNGLDGKWWKGAREFVGTAKTAPEFTLISLGSYPGLCAGGETAVSGETWRVDDQLLATLDRMELNAGYVRLTVAVTGDGEGTAEVYILNDNHRAYHPDFSERFPVVVDGKWKTEDAR